MKTSIRVLERTDAYIIAVWRRVMLLIWRNNPQAIGIDRSQALFGEWTADQPDGAAFLIVVPRQPAGPPDEATRAAMIRAMENRGPSLKGVGTLLEAEGFIAAAARAIMTRLHHKHAHGMAPRVFRSPGEAASWAAELLQDPQLTVGGLLEAIRQARES